MKTCVLVIIVASTLTKISVEEPVKKCQDLDTQACKIFQSAKPDFCSDPTVYSGHCIRFCGKCPVECYDCPHPVKHASDCRTAQCGANQTCMLKQFTGSDGHEEFIMRCEDKTLCEGLLHGFYNVPVGRRSMTFDKKGEWNGPSKRDVSLSLKCCDTDFCNFPNVSTTTTSVATTLTSPTSVATTVTSPTTVATTVTSQTSVATTITTAGPFSHGIRVIAFFSCIILRRPCAESYNESWEIVKVKPEGKVVGCYRDVVFVLDVSGSIGNTNFRHSLDFVRSILQEVDIGPTKTQVALLEYSTHPHVGWYLNTYDSKIDVLNAVNNVRYFGGISHTSDALETVRTQILTQQNGDRPNAENVILVFADGQSNNHIDTLHEANKLHQVSHDVISIVIGSGIDVNELNAIATDNHHTFDLRSYINLSTILPQLMQIICNA